MRRRWTPKPCPSGTHSESGSQDAERTPCAGTPCATGRYGPTGQKNATAATCSAKPCAAGRFSRAGAGACDACPAGQWSAATAAGGCNACGTGTASNATGETAATACAVCEAGAVSGSPDSPTGSSVRGKQCSDWLALRTVYTRDTVSYQEYISWHMADRDVYATVCEVARTSTSRRRSWAADAFDNCKGTCNIGLGAGADACVPCMPGTWSAARAAATCNACAAGRSSAGAGAVSVATCLECPAGRFAGARAARCNECPRGKWAAAGAHRCTPCENGATSTSGAASAALCTVCPPGQHATVQHTCAACAGGDTASCVDAAADGAIVTLGPGTHTFGSEIILPDKHVTIIGAGSGQTTLDRQQGGRFFRVLDGGQLTLRDATVQGGSTAIFRHSRSIASNTPYAFYAMGASTLVFDSGLFPQHGPSQAGRGFGLVERGARLILRDMREYRWDADAQLEPNSATATNMAGLCPQYTTQTNLWKVKTADKTDTRPATNATSVLADGYKCFHQEGVDGCRIMTGLCCVRKHPWGVRCTGCQGGARRVPVPVAESRVFPFLDVACECAAGHAGPECTACRSSCKRCTFASWSEDVGATTPTTCKACAAGKFGRGTQASSQHCVACEGGKYQHQQGRPFCLEHRACSAGKYETSAASSVSARVCRDCPGGKYQPAARALVCRFCRVCPSGLAAEGCGVASEGYCNDCIPGRFIRGTQCADCPAGKFSTAKNAAQCTTCGVGKYQTDHGQPFCKTCPPNSEYSVAAPAKSPEPCVCSAKYFFCFNKSDSGYAAHQDCGNRHLVPAERAKHAGACISCDVFAVGADCSASGSTLANLKSERGFWRATRETATFHRCNPLNKGECRGGAIFANGTADAQCAQGHRGPKCSPCDTTNGYVRKIGKACATCAPGEGIGVMMAAPCAVIAFALVVFMVHKRHPDQARGVKDWVEKRSIKIRILLGFVAIITRVPLCYQLLYPAAVEHFYQALGYLEVIELSGFISGASCLVRSDWTTKVYVQTAIALGVLAAMSALYARARARARDTASRDKRRTAGSGIVNTTLFFSFLIFAPLLTTLLLAYGCTRYEDGRRYLTADLSIDCTDERYRDMLKWAAFNIAVFVVGTPLAYYFMLRRHREALQPLPRTLAEMREAHALGRPGWSHLMRVDDPQIQHLSFLWSGYKPDFWWFE
eukprot:g6640.t1